MKMNWMMNLGIHSILLLAFVSLLLTKSDTYYRYAPNAPFGFRIFSGDVVDMHKYFEQQMDEMIKNFHSTLIGSGRSKFTKIV